MVVGHNQQFRVVLPHNDTGTAGIRFTGQRLPEIGYLFRKMIIDGNDGGHNFFYHIGDIRHHCAQAVCHMNAALCNGISALLGRFTVCLFNISCHGLQFCGITAVCLTVQGPCNILYAIQSQSGKNTKHQSQRYTDKSLFYKTEFVRLLLRLLMSCLISRLIKIIWIGIAVMICACPAVFIGSSCHILCIGSILVCAPVITACRLCTIGIPVLLSGSLIP